MIHNLCLLAVFYPFVVGAQDIPTLERASEITAGTFSNGVDYYMVSNTAAKGFADFALVSKVALETDEARKRLAELPHFQERTPYAFLADNGVGYSENGFIRQTGDATVFSFRDVPTYNEGVRDSTLMLIFDIASMSSGPQAVIVSGDIDVSTLRERMSLLSMMVPKLGKEAARTPYIWRPSTSLDVRVSRNSTSDVAAISAIFRAHRLPEDRMNTLQPIVSMTYAHMLDHIISERARTSFRKEGIPLADTEFRYIDSASGSGDEIYIFTVFTSYGQLDKATGEFASILANLDTAGATRDEFEDAKSTITAEAKRNVKGQVLTNAEYVDKCVASYLYGAYLASGETISKFVSNRRLDLGRELELFNGFVAALLNPARNLTLRFDLPNHDVDVESLRSTFNSAWDEASFGTYEHKLVHSDTLGMYKHGKRVKLSSETEEPVSGGSLWTFSNGTKVVYKQMETSGEVHYALMLRGGVAMVPGLRDGEAAFVGDMLALSDVAGLRGEEFKTMLAANGITMRTQVDVSDMRISGIAPESKLTLLLRSLLTLAGERQPNREDFEYYRESEALRIDMGALSPRNVNSLMDSIMRPDYFYTERKRATSLRDDLPQRAEEYFSDVFSRVNDGLLVIVGDLDEETLKRDLCRIMGNFSVQKKFSQRPRVSSRFASGSVTYTVEAMPGLVGGGELGANVAISASVPFSMDNYIAFKAAVACMQKELVKELAEVGAYVEVSDKVEVFPAERMSVYINCRPCRRDGLPLGIEPAEPLKMLDAVRKVTTDLSEIEVSAADLAAYKELLLKNFDTRSNDPEQIVENVLMRYSGGKDLVSGFKDAVNALSADDLKQILELLDKGAGVEYVII